MTSATTFIHTRSHSLFFLIFLNGDIKQLEDKRQDILRNSSPKTSANKFLGKTLLGILVTIK